MSKVIKVVVLTTVWMIFVIGLLTVLGITPEEFANIPRYGDVHGKY